MDLGITGKRAIVCASSKGLGRGCAEALAEAGCSLVMNARGAEALDATAAEIAETYGVDVQAVAADVTTDEGRQKLLDVAGPTDILVNNAGGPPPGVWMDWGREDFIAALDANMLAPIAMITALVPGMVDRGWGRVVNITSVSVKQPQAQLGLSNSARMGLTGYVAGTARQVAPFGVAMNNLLPGMHATDRMEQLDSAYSRANNVSFDEARATRLAGIPTGTYGSPEDFGKTCAFLCSQHAKFIIGQNVLLDGGATNYSL